MSKQFLQMKYHPAKKEVEFLRFTKRKIIPIRSDSKLYAYMNERGRFVLQDHGNAFFEDIAVAFDGEESVHIEVVTTKIDYEDFLQMLEHYNCNSDVRITATLLAELPSMEETFDVVCEHGNKSIAILQKHQLRFLDVPLEKESVRAFVDMFADSVQKEVDSIGDKIRSMADNRVNLCFAGVYSAGKSALINAILGYQILPEAIKSKTARMFRIQSPNKGEPVRILFYIRHSFSELVWNEESGFFEFGAAPTENNTRKAIQEIINKHKSEPQHRQIYETLKELNSSDDVNAEIHIHFPIPLDNQRVQFTIYDTPGTDSNYGQHQMVLRDALSEQTHSILVFVVAPNKTEGEGNNALLSYLKEAEQKDSKTSIDIGRSLFVVNWADSIGPDERCELQNAILKDKSDDSYSIKLSNKKLFFTSAKVGYAAKAKANGVATKGEEFTIRQQSATISDEDFGRYYRQNRVATSEYATQKHLAACDDALAVAESNNDTLEVLRICSGLYALENEIVNYSEKYASAVRAFAIIDSVDRALSSMNKNAKSLGQKNQESIDTINRDIEELRSTIISGIREAYQKYEYPANLELPNDVMKALCLDSDYVYVNVNEKAKASVLRILKGWFFGLGRVNFKDEHKKEIKEKITMVLSDYTFAFLEKRQIFLEQTRDLFIEDVKNTIRENGKLSDEVKEFVLEIREPEFKKYEGIKDFGEMYDSHKRVDKFWWMDKVHIDKDEFLKDAERQLLKISREMTNDYQKDFHATLMSVLSAVESEFTHNMEEYSLLMQAKLDDKRAMEKLRVKISEAACDLKSCQEELNEAIWSVKNHVE